MNAMEDAPAVCQAELLMQRYLTALYQNLSHFVLIFFKHTPMPEQFIDVLCRIVH